MLVLFIDESGDHNLDKIDPQYPVFVLGGCIVEMQYYKTTMTDQIRAYKKRLFGDASVILHTADIIRRRNVFRKLTDPVFRQTFFHETNELMASMNYRVVACAIKKDEHLRQYGLAAIDPYHLALRIIIERFVFEIKERGEGKGHIIAEARHETLDNLLRLAWMDIRTTGTDFISATDIRNHIVDIHIRDKKQNIPGLQIADLIVSPIGRHVIGKEPKQDWITVEEKFRRGWKGNYIGYGLVVLPKKQAAPE